MRYEYLPNEGQESDKEIPGETLRRIRNSRVGKIVASLGR